MKLITIFIIQLIIITNIYSNQIDSNNKVLLPNTQKIPFTDKEIEWMKNNPIITYSEVNWKPLSIIENNQMNGIMGSFLNLVESRTGLEFKFVPSDSWSQVLDKFRDKQIDIVPGVSNSPQERAYGNLSKRYAQYPMVIVTNNNITYLNDLKDLKNKTIAVPKYYTSYNYIINNYPDIKLIETKTIQEALLLVEEKQADAFVGHIATSIYYLSELFLENLKISGTTNFNFEHYYLIQKDNPILLSIVNKVFDSITALERKEIYSKWIQITNTQETIDYTLSILVTIFSFIIISIIIISNSKLKKEIFKRKELHDRFEYAVDNALCGYWEWNLTNSNLKVSKGWKQHLGYDSKDIISTAKDFISLLHIDDRANVEKTIDNYLTNKSNTYDTIFRMRHKDGKYMWIKALGILNVSNNIFYGFHADISDLKKLEKKEIEHQKNLLEQMKLASMGEMIGNIAHQWRQPLAVISMNANNLKADILLDMIDKDTFSASADNISLQTNQLSTTIDDFKNFIKGDREKKDFHLLTVINRFLSLIDGSIKSNEITIIQNYDNEIEINGYENELIQCFMNIYNNAKDALIKNQIKSKYLFITTLNEENQVTISFKDNGLGIPEDIITKIFEPYFTTKHKDQGIGLGLHMTYNLIVDGMKGNIQVSNQNYTHKQSDCKGAKFSIILPINRD